MLNNHHLNSTLIIKVLLAFVAFLSPLYPLMLIIFIMIIADTFVGRWYAKFKNELVTSRKTRQGFTIKIIVYNVVLFTVYLIDCFILNANITQYLNISFLTTHLVTLFLIWIEFTSIDEKMRWAKGKGIKEMFREFLGDIKNLFKHLTTLKDSAKDIISIKDEKIADK